MYQSATGSEGEVYVVDFSDWDLKGAGFNSLGLMPANGLLRNHETEHTGGTTTTTGAATVMNMTAITTGSAPVADALIGQTITIEEGESDVAYRTITDNTATTLTFVSSYTFVSGDTWEVTDLSCQSQRDFDSTDDEHNCDTGALVNHLTATTASTRGTSSIVPAG